jgi:CRP-like cAMP-binding protein
MSREIFVAAFGEIPDRVVDRAVRAMDERALADGDTLFEEGAAPESIFFMRDGRVRMTRASGVAWRCEGRWMLGFHDANCESPHAATAIAEGPLRVLHVRSNAWFELLEDCFDLTKRLLESTARAVADLEERVPVVPISSELSRPTTLVDELSSMFGGLLRVFQPGDVLLPAGAERRELLFVTSGEVRARNASAGISRVYVEGDIVTGAAAFSAAGTRWEAIGSKPGRVLVLPIDVWNDAIEASFDLARSALCALGSRRQLLVETLARKADLVLT